MSYSYEYLTSLVPHNTLLYIYIYYDSQHISSTCVLVNVKLLCNSRNIDADALLNTNSRGQIPNMILINIDNNIDMNTDFKFLC